MARWRRRVGKLSDFSLEIGAGSSVWTKARHEPLLMFVCLPLACHRAWKLRGTVLLDGYERKMRELHKTNSRLGGRLLRKLFVQARQLETMPDGLVRGLLQHAREQPVSNQDPGR